MTISRLQALIFALGLVLVGIAAARAQHGPPAHRNQRSSEHSLLQEQRVDIGTLRD